MSFALVDCNSFFCSCERLFRPELNDKPVIVLSNNDGCAIARTPEAKKLGIKMGDPFFKIKEICKTHKVHVFSSNFSLYTNISDRVMLSLCEMTDLVEVYSVDEAFLNFKGFKEEDFLSHGRRIKEVIQRDVGIPVGVGIGPTKVLSKIANNLAKKSTKSRGVVSLHTKEFQTMALQRTPVEDIWGIGKANSVKMKSLGIRTALDLRDYKNERLIQKMFTKTGLQIKHELMGINCMDLNLEPQKKKEIMCSRSFGSSVYDKETLKESIANYVSKACESLRAQNSVAGSIEVFFRTNAFKDTSQYYAFESKKLLSPTLDTLKTIRIAHDLVDKIFKEGYEYKKAGIRLTNIIDKNQRQLSLFEQTAQRDQEQLMEIMDKINRIEGERTIHSAACGVRGHAWAMLRQHKSPRYTTSWNELKKVK